MVSETRFDDAWEHWRQQLTDALAEERDPALTQVVTALRDAGAIDPADGLIRREWALGLMTEEPAYIGRLRQRGVDAAACAQVVALIQRHPTPAAGG